MYPYPALQGVLCVVRSSCLGLLITFRSRNVMSETCARGCLAVPLPRSVAAVYIPCACFICCVLFYSLFSLLYGGVCFSFFFSVVHSQAACTRGIVCRTYSYRIIKHVTPLMRRMHSITCTRYIIPCFTSCDTLLRRILNQVQRQGVPFSASTRFVLRVFCFVFSL